MTTIEGNKLIAVVYRITNSVNGKFYIGSSSAYTKRMKRHFEDLKSGCHHCKPLQRAYNKYGKDSFVIDILKEFKYYTVQDILCQEQFFLDSLHPQYNVCKTAGSQLGAKRSKQFKDKCSKRMKGFPPWNKGKKIGKQSIYTINKRSVSLMGQVFSPERKDKIKAAVSNPIIQMNKNGTIIKEWNSLKEVSKNLPCSHGRLSEYVNNKSNISTFKGFIWKLKKTA